MRSRFRPLVSLVLSAALLLGCVSCGGSAKAPTTITVWNYYSGDLLSSFNALVNQFNATVGKEKNIVVESFNQGSVTDLEANVLAAAQGKVGAAALPNLYSGYADMAYDLDLLGEVVDLATMEGVVEVARQYYDWTDAMTSTPNDGKAFFGRDALANYLLCGAQEMGLTIFDAENGVMTLHFDKDVIRKLWDNFYVPYIKGWFGASGKFRSDDVKTGNLLAYVGSSSSSPFFPAQVMTNDTESHAIEPAILPCPSFAGCTPVAAQQGAGMIVTKGTDAQIRACVEFLKWFTQPENNIAFSVNSGYLPVTHAAASPDAIQASGLELTDLITQVLDLSLDAVEHDALYTTHAFPEGSTARITLQNAMTDAAEADRAIVKERLAAGQTPEEAESEFLTDEYFDQWYESTKAALEAYAG